MSTGNLIATYVEFSSQLKSQDQKQRTDLIPTTESSKTNKNILVDLTASFQKLCTQSDNSMGGESDVIIPGIRQTSMTPTTVGSKRTGPLSYDSPTGSRKSTSSLNKDSIIKHMQTITEAIKHLSDKAVQKSQEVLKQAIEVRSALFVSCNSHHISSD